MMTFNTNIELEHKPNNSSIPERFITFADIYKNDSDTQLDFTLSFIFRELGMRCANNGYKYLKYAIKLCLEDDHWKDKGVTKYLYPEIAKKFGTTDKVIERAIRVVIEGVNKYGDLQSQYKYLGSIEGHYTNTDFIARIVELMNLNRAK